MLFKRILLFKIFVCCTELENICKKERKKNSNKEVVNNLNRMKKNVSVQAFSNIYSALDL